MIETTKDGAIVLKDGELEALIMGVPCGTPVDCVFGSFGVALKNPPNEPESPAVKLLLASRGVSNENKNGAGI